MAELLLVDDEPELALIVGLLGKRAGHRVVCCPDVPSAWERLGEARPDLVLLDVNLPGASGLELCRRLRAAPAARAGLTEVPVALFVQSAMVGDVAAGLEAGADFLFAKELVGRPDEWQRRVNELLARVHGQRGGRSLECDGGRSTVQVPEDWVARANRALALPPVRGLGAEVLRLVLRRAWARAFPEGAQGGDWLTADGARLDPERVPPSPSWPHVVRLVDSLADQVWCLLGAEASGPFWAILR